MLGLKGIREIPYVTVRTKPPAAKPKRGIGKMPVDERNWALVPISRRINNNGRERADKEKSAATMKKLPTRKDSNPEVTDVRAYLRSGE
jgi:hypothetical protein